MDNPPYSYRSKGELRSALRFAQRVLHLRDWTIYFAIDEHSINEHVRKRLFDDRTAVAAVTAGPGFLVAWMGLWRDRAPAANFDALFSVFHEMAHVVMWESVDHQKGTQEERAACRIAWLLWKLWHKR